MFIKRVISAFCMDPGGVDDPEPPEPSTPSSGQRCLRGLSDGGFGPAKPLLGQQQGKDQDRPWLKGAESEICIDL
jgi:hypothetical protein